MPAAWVVEVIARKRRAPIFQNTNQLTGTYVRQHLVFRYVGQSQPLQCGGKAESDTVEDQLPFNAHSNFASVLLEVPRKQAAISRKANVDAVVCGEVLR